MALGTVGLGVYKIINSKKEQISNILSEDIEIKKILVKNLNKKRNTIVNKDLLTDNYKDILDDPEINIVVEVIGGMNPAFEYIKSALKRGKHVVTANKEVVANYLEELLELSEKNNKRIFFEASVGGGIPIIKSLSQIALINDITQIKGIINGTSNFILTKMVDDCTSFNDSLALAKELGYAEANAKDDVEGDDVARKLSILSSLAFKTKVSAESILYRGISSIDKIDILNFKNMNKSIKLIATAIKDDNRISACVEPTLIEENSQFATVNNCFNMISITGNTVQELQFYGQGAGEKPTANAVVSDIIDAIKPTYSVCSLKKYKEKYDIDAHIFNGDYYFRVTTSGEKENEDIINLLIKSKISYEILEKTCNLVLKIKSIYEDKMDKFISKFKTRYENFCYVRIAK
ncbi:homoserine dehydrogenase [Clostridium putrefaciens]|uniref:homoserine dehydrogenase n=1 Tax=Clostridium putrefaciens TaxID=99675 RepID=UPI000E1FB73C